MYGFPSDTPCYEAAKKLVSPHEKAKLYEKQILQDVCELLKDYSGFSETKFIPHIQPYEYESFLFVDSYCCAYGLTDDEKQCKYLEAELNNIIRLFETPEHINNNPEKAPSKRIEKLAPIYKHKAGISWPITRDIGISKIREKCFHFNEWLTFIETYNK